MSGGVEVRPVRDLQHAFQDIDDELETHVRMLVEVLCREGLSEESALAEALRRFGSVSRARNACRRLAIKECLMSKKAMIVTGSAFAGLLLVSAFVVLVLQRQAAMQAAVAREHALMAQQQMLHERQRAAEAASSLLIEVLTQADPQASGGRQETSVKEVLDAAAERLDAGVVDDPRVEAHIREILDKARQQLDQPER